MWIRRPQERLLNGMPVTPVECSNCHKIWTYFDKMDRRCLNCGAVHDLVLNEDGEMETTDLLDTEKDEIKRLQEENQALKTQIAMLLIMLAKEGDS